MTIPINTIPFKLCNHLTVTTVTGKDSTVFLHSQFTNDVQNLEYNQIQIQGYCTPKGRLLCTFYLVRHAENDYSIIMNTDQSDAILKRLRMYVMRAKVTFEQTSIIPRIIDDLDAYLQFFSIQASAIAKGNFTTMGNHIIANIGLHIEWYIAWELNNSASTLQTKQGYNDWMQMEFRDGVTLVNKQSSEQHLPQSINLDLIGGVNFRKGCYPGQEIVARLRYLGKSKQRMLCFSSTSDNIPEIGAFLYCANKKVATIVSCAVAEDSTYNGLAATYYAKVDWNNVHLEDGNEVIIFKPPYSIPELEQSDNIDNDKVEN